MFGYCPCVPREWECVCVSIPFVPLPGKLASVAPSRVVPDLAELTHSADALTRWTAVTSVKYAVVSVGARKDVRAHVGVFLELLADPALPVRLAALVTVNAIVHVEAVLIQHVVTPVASSSEEKVPEPVPPEVCAGHDRCRWWVARRVVCGAGRARWLTSASCRSCSMRCNRGTV